MSRDPEPLIASLPAISDESVVEILDWLQAFVVGFESFYGGQIRRYYEERSCINRIQPEPMNPLDDPPF
jgi:hypothetical protein